MEPRSAKEGTGQPAAHPGAGVSCSTPTDKLERLGRYESIDRNLERTLAMLLRLKDLRQGAIAG